MKKIGKILILLLILVLLCSCGSINNSSNDNSSTNNDISSNTSDNSSDTNDFFSTNRIETENLAIFTDLIKDNPIDKAYHSAKSDDTVQSMLGVEVEYANIWMEELEYSVESFTALLNKDDKAEFEKIQEDWQKNISDSKLFINGIFNNKDYNTLTGQMYLVEEASNYRNEVRKRALYIKYLQFNFNQDGEETVEFKWKG